MVDFTRSSSRCPKRIHVFEVVADRRVQLDEGMRGHGGKKNTLLAQTRILPLHCCKDYSVLIASTMSPKHRCSSTRVNPVGTCLYPHYNCPH